MESSFITFITSGCMQLICYPEEGQRGRESPLRLPGQILIQRIGVSQRRVARGFKKTLTQELRHLGTEG